VIAALLAAALTLAPAEVLARYAAALATVRTPSALTFEYTLNQTGMRNSEQMHRIFRSGNDERDELLVMDGRKVVPPRVRIFHGRRNRYTLAGLAPNPEAYAFRFVGTAKAGRHVDYVFETTPRAPGAFRVTTVTIDGVAFVPSALAFAAPAHAGSGTMTFARFDRYWLPTAVTARATYREIPTTEHLTFARYRFPERLPPATFAVPRALDETP
jgi:hypothetical protein